VLSGAFGAPIAAPALAFLHFVDAGELLRRKAPDSSRGR
jgi:hypothetical protein